MFSTTAFAGHWTTSTTSPTIMHIVGKLTINGSAAQIGDEVAIFGATGNLVGSYVVDTAAQYGDLVVVGDNTSTTTLSEGALTGEALSVKVWQASTAKEYSGSEISLAATSDYVQFSYNPVSLPLVFAANAFTGLNITATGSTTSLSGSCGTSNGGTFTVAPTTNFCTSGTASAVTGSGLWWRQIYHM